VLINYYIIEDGELYRNLKRLLAKKIQQGVKVYMIFDFVGSFAKLSLREQDELRKLGVNLQVYMPMLMPFLN
jgi:cardiolipin synthase